MVRQIILAPNASAEIEEAYAWYENQELGLGERFFHNLKRAVHLAASQPTFYPVKFDAVRRIGVLKFPYTVYFEHNDSTLYVQSVFHHSRDPKSLESLRK